VSREIKYKNHIHQIKIPLSKMSSSSHAVATHFFPHSLTRLLIIVANETDPDHDKPLSPHDHVVIDDVHFTSNAKSNTIFHTLPTCADSKTKEYKRLTKYVQDFLDLPAASPLSSPTTSTLSSSSVGENGINSIDHNRNGVIVCASARHFRFYEKWSFQFYTQNVHVINTGQTTDEHNTKESFLRSVQRALRVVSPELHLHKQSLNVVWSIHVDAICYRSDETSSIIVNHPSHQEQEYTSSSCLEEKILIGNDENKKGAITMLSVFGSDLSERLVQKAMESTVWGNNNNSDSTTTIFDDDEVMKKIQQKVQNVPLRNHLTPVSSNDRDSNINNTNRVFIGRSYARVGLMGNPSDQFHGKSIAVTVKNFWSTVCLIPNEINENHNDDNNDNTKISFVPHPVSDDFMNFTNIGSVRNQVLANGYTGGIRLLQATLKRFFEHTHHQITSSLSSPSSKASAQKVLDKMKTQGFSLAYDTNVPRQVGLAGSSCIVSAALKALLQFYQVFDCPHFMPINNRPTFVLEVESKEHGINAGLMDRVAQMFEGCVEMDFTNPELTKEKGHAIYTRHPVSSLPPLHLAVALDPSDSGKLHATVAKRFREGDQEVLDAVKNWVKFVDEAVQAIGKQDHAKIRSLMDQNFNLRRKVYGDECLGWKNLRMVEIARQHHASTKFPGSGGAVLVATDPEKTNVEALAADLETHGFSLVKLEVFEPSSSSSSF